MPPIDKSNCCMSTKETPAVEKGERKLQLNVKVAAQNWNWNQSWSWKAGKRKSWKPEKTMTGAQRMQAVWRLQRHFRCRQRDVGKVLALICCLLPVSLHLWESLTLIPIPKLIQSLYVYALLVLLHIRHEQSSTWRNWKGFKIYLFLLKYKVFIYSSLKRYTIFCILILITKF